MLGKLIKYDCRNILNKGLIVFYALAVFFGLLTRLFLGFENSLALHIIGKICSGVTISMFFNILINNLMRMWVRFKYNLYGDESYLTHTLPIEKSTHYAAKFIASLITTLASTAVILLTAFIAYYSKDFWETVKAMLSPIIDMFGNKIIVLLIVILFLEFFNILQCGFTGIILGHKMNSAKTGFSVLLGFMIYCASQTITVLTVLAVAIFNEDLMKIFTTGNAIISGDTANLVLYLATGVYTALIIAGFILNTKLLKQGVNVD